MTEFEKALELKPCPNPWCEGRETYQDEHSAGVMVRCAKCDLKGPPRPTEAEAAAAWNTRPTHKAAPVSDGVVERARELLAEALEERATKVEERWSAAPNAALHGTDPHGEAKALRAKAARYRSGKFFDGTPIWETDALRAIERALSGLDEAIEALESAAETLWFAGEEHGCMPCTVAANRARTVAANLRGQPK